jgi:hypothetical protein
MMMPTFFRRLGWKFIQMILLGLFISTGVTASAFAAEQIHLVKLKAEQLPREWKLTNEFSIPERQLAQLKSRFSASIEAIFYQTLRFKRDGEVRLNYLVCPTEAALKEICQKLVALVGQNNIVVRRGNILVEIIAEENRLKEAVVGFLPLSSLQKQKLHAANAPSGWRLVRELFALPGELDGFNTRYGVTCDEMINQFFLVRDQQIRVNYLAAATERDASITHRKLVDAVGGVNAVFRKQNIITELIAEDPALRQEAERFLNPGRERR